MRKTLDVNMEAARVKLGPWGSLSSDGLNGAFMVMGPKGAELRIIASSGQDPEAGGWEHVSVSCASMHRCPNWPEMCWVKDQFWDEEETVIQFHPPRSEYVNHHPTTLHLWRSRTSAIVTPPAILVGPK
jgi:hypothetical protein